MNPEIVKGQIRSLIIACGGLAAGWFASKGWFSTEQVTAILSSPVFFSIATMAAGFIWSAITHRQDNAVAVVTQIARDPNSPVRGVITENTSAGRELAKSIEGPVVVAGTTDAARIAKT